MDPKSANDSCCTSRQALKGQPKGKQKVRSKITDDDIEKIGIEVNKMIKNEKVLYLKSQLDRNCDTANGFYETKNNLELCFDSSFTNAVGADGLR